MAPRFALLVLLLALLPLVLPHPVRLPSAPCAAQIAARSLEGRGAHRVLRTSLRVTCRADVFRPRHPGGAHVACGEAPVTRTGSCYNGNEGETEGGRTDGGEDERPTDGCRAVPELSSCTAASESVGSGGAEGRTRVTIRLEQPVPRGLYADPFELERILRPGEAGRGALVGAWDGGMGKGEAGGVRSEGEAGGVRSEGGEWAPFPDCISPPIVPIPPSLPFEAAGDRAWVVGPVELEQPAPRCEATVALMERDVRVGGKGDEVQLGKGDGEGDGKGEGEGEGEGDMQVGEDEVAFSVDFSLPLHSRYPAVLPTLSPPLSLLSLLRSASHSLLTLASLPWDFQQLKATLSSNHSSLSALSSLSRAIAGSCSQSHTAVHCLPMRLTWSSQTAAADGETDRLVGAAGLGGDSEGSGAALSEGRHDEERGEKAEEGALLWEVPAGCAAHTPLVLWGTSLAAAVGALVLVAVAAAAPVHPGATKAK
ncbi:unnamed protein product [Closterium sp. Naga37s-1]|nr:unnamed protein product [Closterium sp. Naga37s-1]